MVDIIESLLKERCGRRTILCVDNIRLIPIQYVYRLKSSNVMIITPSEIYRTAGYIATAIYFINIDLCHECVHYLRTRLRGHDESTLEMRFYWR